MNWEEIVTPDKPVSFMECAIIARYGGEIPKGELWAWKFEDWELAHDCFRRLDPAKYTYSGIRIELKEKPVPPRIWMVQLAQAQRPGMVHSRVFREFPTPEKLDEPVDENSMFHLVLWEETEKRYLIQAYLTFQQMMQKSPEQKDFFCPFVLDIDCVLPGYPRLLCIVSTQEIR